MHKTSLILGTYNHLPDGFPDSEFETVYNYCYRPFLSALNRFPDIQVCMFFSGSLFKKLETRHPEYLLLLEELTARRQVEIIGGGYYSPVFPIIQSSERLGQIELLTTYIRKRFGRRPRGCWLYEYAWEPWLASTLQSAGMDYSFIGAGQFRNVLGDKAALGPVITEDQGRTLRIIPTWDTFYDFPQPGSYLDALETLAAQKNTGKFLCIMQPGEKLKALWEKSGCETPDLYVEQVFSSLQKKNLEYDISTPLKYIKATKPAGRAYFPGSASRLFLDAINDSPVKDTSIRSCITKYAAGSALYSRMHHVYIAIGQLRGDKTRKKSAYEDLWKGQTGDAYWLAPTGGIARSSIRKSVYNSIMVAELTTRTKESFKSGLIRTDIDFDGVNETFYQGTDYNAYLNVKGACIIELDIARSRKNLCDLFNAEQDISRAKRASFIDRIYPDKYRNYSALAPWEGDISRLGSSVFTEAEQPQGAVASQISTSFIRDFSINTKRGLSPLSIRKEYIFLKKQINLKYSVFNKSASQQTFVFATELNLALLPDELSAIISGDQKMDSETARIEVENTTGISFKGKEKADSITINSTMPLTASIELFSWEMPDGSKETQGYSLLLLWKLDIKPGQEWNNELGMVLYD